MDTLINYCNSIDDYSEKYGMTGGLVQKSVTAPVVPAAELLIGHSCTSS